MTHLFNCDTICDDFDDSIKYDTERNHLLTGQTQIRNGVKLLLQVLGLCVLGLIWECLACQAGDWRNHKTEVHSPSSLLLLQLQ